MNKTLRTFLYIFIFSAIGAIIFLLYNPFESREVEFARKVITEKVKSKTNSIVKKEKQTPTMERFTYTSEKDGKVEWSLTSTSGTRSGDGDLINLEGIDLVFYSSDGSRNTLKAKTGSFVAKDSRVRLDGNIVLLSDKGLRLEADTLDYLVSKRVIETETSVSVHGDKFDIKGTGLKMDIDSGDFEFKSSVSGGFMYGFL